MICSNMDSGECIKSKHLVSAGYGTFSSMPSSAKEPREDTYTSSSSPKGRSSSVSATLGPLYGFNPHILGSDVPYQGLPFGSHFPSGDAMPSGSPPMFSSSAGERLYLFTFTINKLQIQTTCKIAELIKAGSMETCLSHHTILF